MRLPLEKFGSVGSVIAAAACPVCFPKLALLGAFFGMGALSAYEYQLFIAAQALVVVALLGQGLAYRRDGNGRALAASLLSGIAVFAGLYLAGSEALVYVGFAGLVGASATGLWNRRRLKTQ